ncbi:RIC1-domain-containing protein [Fomitopsis serialis]|uniref:RIC1-domain-containing protein n=1 Tax=Fomitopsis serialis TaxID=139415 RepID=UPI0020072966|nr:RIC1-domain-containing protein [Neoantrodia serialis]KAH9937401.1 RIC1-domain-containing protein [Neoantrodia serialis]
MYFPSSAARQLSTAPALPVASEPVICLSPSPRKSLFCTLTKGGLSAWRVRPSAVLAHLARTPTSLSEHGENVSMSWSPNGRNIVIQTARSYLVIVTVDYDPQEIPYQPPQLAPSAQRHFLPGPGEALPFQSIGLHLEGVVRLEGTLLSVLPRNGYILFTTKSPSTVQRIPWPGMQSAEDQCATWYLNDEDFPWLVDSDVCVTKMVYSKATGIETWVTSDGRAYLVQLDSSEADYPRDSLSNASQDSQQLQSRRDSQESTREHPEARWQGTCIHNVEPPRWVQKRRRQDPGELRDGEYPYDEPRRVMTVGMNTGFLSLPPWDCGAYRISLRGRPSSNPQVLQIPNMYAREGTGPVLSMEWSSDGYVLAVGWEKGWAIWSVGGRCLAWGFGVEYEVDPEKFQDSFMYGVTDLFWAPGNFELVVLAKPAPDKTDGQLFVIPFAKSATTGQHSPDNTQYAFLQMDDRVLVYRGADQPDMSVINPESDVWQHVKIPHAYLSANWPIRYSALSADGRLIAVAGRRGLAHYSTTSGRWKLFADDLQEHAFAVKGGLLWFHHVLIAAVDVANSYQIRLYSRDLELSNQNVLHREILTTPVVVLSLVDNSLLVYTADNTLHHYLIIPTAETIKLHQCGSISFAGVISVPGAVRSLSWMIPSAQKQLGDPVDDLAVATVLMIVGGKLVLFRPRRSGDNEVRYDMQILADKIEFCWIHLRGIGTLENSLWGYDGQGIRLWLNALNIESAVEAGVSGSPGVTRGNVKESLNIPLQFYPLSVLMDKGIFIGVEYEAATRTNLSFTMFRQVTSSHLFLHHVLLYHLENGQVREAILFASHYQHLVYLAHALEMTLHNVVEEDATLQDGDGSAKRERLLPDTIEFLDHFDICLDVVVGCARKIEMTRWARLFDVVGNPKDLFELCLSSNRLKTAGSYLLVLHGLDQLDADGVGGDAVRLLRSAITVKDWQLCREILRFLHFIDETGGALRKALSEADVVPASNGAITVNGIH